MKPDPILSAEQVAALQNPWPRRLAVSHEQLRTNAETLASNWMQAEDRANALREALTAVADSVSWTHAREIARAALTLESTP